VNAPSLFTGTTSYDAPPALFRVGLVLEVAHSERSWPRVGDLFHVQRRHKSVLVLQHECTGSMTRIPFFKSGQIEEHADETWTLGHRARASDNPRYRVRYDLEPHGPEYADTPTRLLRETLAASNNEIEAAFAALHKSSSPNASSARMILARAQRQYAGASHARYTGRGSFDAVRPNLHVIGWYDAGEGAEPQPKDLGPYEGVVVEPGAWRLKIDENAVRGFLDTVNPRPLYASIRNEDSPKTFVTSARLGRASE
jgi:hypothetical protein